MADLTIDELARQAGISVRNVRSHHSRGLLPPPEVRGRTGYYGEEHLERLRLIQELQADGLPLRLVERLLVADADSASRLVALRRTVMSPLEPGEPVIVTLPELTERFGELDDESLQRAVALGALLPRVDGTFQAPLPGLLDTAEEVIRHGVSLPAALQIAQQVRYLCDEAAQSFVELIMNEVWTPFDEAGRPEPEWPVIASAIDAVRPLANEIFMQLLPVSIGQAIERAFGEELREEAEHAGEDT